MRLHSYVSNSFQFSILSLESSQADLLCQTILIISRLGPSFLSLEPRGIQTIVDAMARHRSDKNLQDDCRPSSLHFGQRRVGFAVLPCWRRRSMT